MKAKLLFVAAALLASLPAAFAQLTIPSDGSDGSFNPTSSIQIDLSQAITGTWSANNTANAGKGIYDPAKWAIVFKYASVNIPAGVSVTFVNHPSHAPVVWLVQGSVNIAGIINLEGRNGGSATSYSIPTEPGPGGFRGGAQGSLGRGSGLGIGGTNGNSFGAQAAYASVYGNPSVIPLIGGSGGGSSDFGYAGGAGGGAILIAAPNSISLLGTISTNGGYPHGNASYGSGGAIRLIANAITGSGTLTANNDGRIRIEANSVSGNVVPSPQTIAVPPANPPVIWPGATAPTVRVVSVDANAAPTYPIGSLDTAADVGISANASTQVILQTTNFPINGLVQVRSAGKFNTTPVFTTATLQSGDANSALWSATITFATGFTTLQARATVP